MFLEERATATASSRIYLHEQCLLNTHHTTMYMISVSRNDRQSVNEMRNENENVELQQPAVNGVQSAITVSSLFECVNPHRFAHVRASACVSASYSFHCPKFSDEL